jgi:hypothetical protein
MVYFLVLMKKKIFGSLRHKLRIKEDEKKMLMVKTIQITRHEVAVIIDALKAIELETGLSQFEQGLLERMEELFEQMS